MDTFGYLELIIGPMFSGKTTRLIELYHTYKNQGKNVMVINYSADKRYHESMLSTHDRVMIPCIFTDKLAGLTTVSNSEYNAADIILINEGQFFSDLYETVFHMVETSNKYVYISGLNADFRREKFGELLELIPICDNIVYLTARCHDCNGKALHSHRICSSVEQVLIGSDIYVPLCRQCYNHRQTGMDEQVAETII